MALEILVTGTIKNLKSDLELLTNKRNWIKIIRKIVYCFINIKMERDKR